VAAQSKAKLEAAARQAPISQVTQAAAAAAAAAVNDLTAEEALAQAADEKLVLVTSASATGYKCVHVHGGRFTAQIWENGERTYIGCFGTAEEAALQYARLLGRERSAAAAAEAAAAIGRDLTAEEAITLAIAEGLTLVPSAYATRYKGVTVDRGRYMAKIRENGKVKLIGCFGTAEEAALQYARLLGPMRSAAEAKAAKAAAAATTSCHSRKRPSDALPSDAAVARLSGRIRRAPTWIE
jgi:hypothetical protein